MCPMKGFGSVKSVIMLDGGGGCLAMAGSIGSTSCHRDGAVLVLDQLRDRHGLLDGFSRASTPRSWSPPAATTARRIAPFQYSWPSSAAPEPVGMVPTCC